MRRRLALMYLVGIFFSYKITLELIDLADTNRLWLCQKCRIYLAINL